MDDYKAISTYICPLMSGWDGIKHCSYNCRFYDVVDKTCVIAEYLKRKKFNQDSHSVTDSLFDDFKPNDSEPDTKKP